MNDTGKEQETVPAREGAAANNNVVGVAAGGKLSDPGRRLRIRDADDLQSRVIRRHVRR